MNPTVFCLFSETLEKIEVKTNKGKQVYGTLTTITCVCSDERMDKEVISNQAIVLILRGNWIIKC